MARVLIVEPDVQLAKIYSQALEAVGFKVSRSATAQSAIYTADEARPDLVLLEVQMVGHSGIEFLYEFRSYPDWQDIPAIIISNVPPGELADCRQLLEAEMGVVGHHYKLSLSLSQLVQLVEKALPARKAVANLQA